MGSEARYRQVFGPRVAFSAKQCLAGAAPGRMLDTTDIHEQCGYPDAQRAHAGVAGPLRQGE